MSHFWFKLLVALASGASVSSFSLGRPGKLFLSTFPPSFIIIAASSQVETALGVQAYLVRSKPA
jgi:hypothetical protein